MILKREVNGRYCYEVRTAQVARAPRPNVFLQPGTAVTSFSYARIVQYRTKRLGFPYFAAWIESSYLLLFGITINFLLVAQVSGR